MGWPPPLDRHVKFHAPPLFYQVTLFLAFLPENNYDPPPEIAFEKCCPPHLLLKKLTPHNPHGLTDLSCYCQASYPTSHIHRTSNSRIHIPIVQPWFQHPISYKTFLIYHWSIPSPLTDITFENWYKYQPHHLKATHKHMDCYMSSVHAFALHGEQRHRTVSLILTFPISSSSCYHLKHESKTTHT